MAADFDYDIVFSRNIGWVTEREQAILRGKRVAIAGLGGVGGSHLLTLARLGVGTFHISDFDSFDLVNFNRQAGATMSHLGRSKVDVLAEMALDINPEMEIRRFPEGVKEDNVDEFLDGVDLYVDGLDFFAVAARRMVFAECAERSIPSTTAAPLGMGVSALNFVPGKTTFEIGNRLTWKRQLDASQGVCRAVSGRVKTDRRSSERTQLFEHEKESPAIETSRNTATRRPARALGGVASSPGR